MDLPLVPYTLCLLRAHYYHADIVGGLCMERLKDLRKTRARKGIRMSKEQQELRKKWYDTLMKRRKNMEISSVSSDGSQDNSFMLNIEGDLCVRQRILGALCDKSKKNNGNNRSESVDKSYVNDTFYVEAIKRVLKRSNLGDIYENTYKENTKIEKKKKTGKAKINENRRSLTISGSLSEGHYSEGSSIDNDEVVSVDNAEINFITNLKVRFADNDKVSFVDGQDEVNSENDDELMSIFNDVMYNLEIEFIEECNKRKKKEIISIRDNSLAADTKHRAFINGIVTKLNKTNSGTAAKSRRHVITKQGKNEKSILSQTFTNLSEEEESLESSVGESLKSSEDESLKSSEGESLESSEDESLKSSEGESLESSEEESLESSEEESLESSEEENIMRKLNWKRREKESIMRQASLEQSEEQGKAKTSVIGQINVEQNEEERNEEQSIVRRTATCQREEEEIMERQRTMRQTYTEQKEEEQRAEQENRKRRKTLEEEHEQNLEKEKHCYSKTPLASKKEEIDKTNDNEHKKEEPLQISEIIANNNAETDSTGVKQRMAAKLEITGANKKTRTSEKRNETIAGREENSKFIRNKENNRNKGKRIQKNGGEGSDGSSSGE